MKPSTQTLRLAEVLGALSLATDLANGNPLETALRTCLAAVELAREVGAGEQEIADAYDAAMLRYLGCTAYASEEAAALGDDIAAKQGWRGRWQARGVVTVPWPEVPARWRCTWRRGWVGAGVTEALGQIYERWDGRGAPAGNFAIENDLLKG